MEYIQGGCLFDQVVAKRKFNEQDVATIVMRLLSCMSYCHSQEIVHRDLKPANIMLEASKDFDQIKIIDFGTALKISKGKTL
jgi:calcium-dependent protein kinase